VTLGPQGAEPVDERGLIILRTADTGEANEFFPTAKLVKARPGHGTLTWEDTATRRGRTYRYYTEYSSDVYLCSNPVVLTIPATLRETRGQGRMLSTQEDPLFVEVAAPEAVGTNRTFLAVARASKPGGTYRWEGVTPSTAIVVLERRNRALLRGLAWPATWRVHYTLGRETAQAYYCPGVVSIRLTSLTGVYIGHRHWSERPERVAERDRRAARMGRPDGFEELRSAIRYTYGKGRMAPAPNTQFGLLEDVEITQSAIQRVGSRALLELHAFFDECTDPDQRGPLVRAMCDIDKEYVLMSLSPDFLRSEDVTSVTTAIRMLFGYRASTRLTAGVAHDLAPGLDSPVDSVRILSCRTLGRHHASPVLPALRKMILSDRNPLVRFWAASAQHTITSGDKSLDVDLQRGPAVIDSADVEHAAMIRQEVLDEIRDAGRLVDNPGSACMEFRALGSAALPALIGCLTVDDCGPVELKALGEVLGDIGAGIPRRVKTFHAELVRRSEGHVRTEAFRRYMAILENVLPLWHSRCNREPNGIAFVEKHLDSGFSDQCFMLAALSAKLDVLDGRNRTTKTSHSHGWRWRCAGNVLRMRLNRKDGLLAELAREFLVPPLEPPEE
jgi:hypothetical protein